MSEENLLRALKSIRAELRAIGFAIDAADTSREQLDRTTAHDLKNAWRDQADKLEPPEA